MWDAQQHTCSAFLRARSSISRRSSFFSASPLAFAWASAPPAPTQAEVLVPYVKPWSAGAASMPEGQLCMKCGQ